jgi:AraC-like DNA-binding protein
MPPASHENSVLLLRPVAAVLARIGVDGDRFLADAGVRADTAPDAYVPSAGVDRALEAIARARGDEAFGLTLARAAVVRPLGLFGHLVWLSGTLRDAMTRATRFYSLVTRRATLGLEAPEGSPVATVTQRMIAGPGRGDILTEFAFGSLFLRARAAIGAPFQARAMRFSHRAREAAPYEAFFEAPVTFGAPHDALSFDAALLDLPLASADPVTAQVIEAQATALHAKSGGVEPSFSARVRAAVDAEVRSGRPSLASTARRLGVATRSLRRRLDEEDLSIRELVASARRDRATELLASGASIKMVAFALGFSEPSAFSRAYKRWTGRAPSARKTPPDG